MRAWAAVHALRPAAAAWAAGAVLVPASGRSTVPLFGHSGAGRATPTALLIPLVLATAVSFAVHDDAAALTRQRSRSILAARATWDAVVLLPGALVAAAAAGHSHEISVVAAQRNYLAFTAITVAALRVLAPGMSAIPAAAAAFASIALVGSASASWLPQPWNWLVQTQTTPSQLVVVGLACLSALAWQGSWGERG